MDVMEELRTRYGAVCRSALGSDGTVESFGNAAAERLAVETAGVVVPLTGMIRIRVEGRDRAKYLHNFCTSQIRELSVGAACEAFFTDVKARVLGHGWVLAGERFHEILMLAGDEPSLLKHLGKYVITEDVQFRSLSTDCVTLAVFGARAPQILQQHAPDLPRPEGENRWVELTPADAAMDGMVLRIGWAEAPLLLFSLPPAGFHRLWTTLTQAGLIPAGWPVFERQRILERFPAAGVDITSDHLAPEADRNATAISYTKGCYLGQEPIARLDAMGHINRAVRTLRVQAGADECRGAAVVHRSAGPLGHITSVAADLPSDTSVALAMIRIHGIDLSQGVTVVTRNGQTVTAEVL